jgi:hypothetical protein
VSELDIISPPLGTYGTILNAAAVYAPEPELTRLGEIENILEVRSNLRDGYSAALDFSRAAYATFLLTGQALLRVRGTISGVVGGSDLQAETLLDWRRFETSPDAHQGVVEELSLPLPPVMRLAMLDLIKSLLAGNMPTARSSLRSLILQVGRYDAAGGRQVVDAAVSCLLPPVVREFDLPMDTKEISR